MPRFPSRIPPLKSEMSLHIALMAARRDAPKVRLMKYTWPQDASGLRFAASQPPPAAPGRDPAPSPQPALGKLRGADELESERQGPAKRLATKQPREAAALGGVACSSHLKSRSSATASEWKDCKNLILPRDLGAPSGPNSVPLADCTAAALATAAKAATAV